LFFVLQTNHRDRTHTLKLAEELDHIQHLVRRNRHGRRCGSGLGYGDGNGLGAARSSDHIGGRGRACNLGGTELRLGRADLDHVWSGATNAGQQAH
jgi:hypothetical protein